MDEPNEICDASRLGALMWNNHLPFQVILRKKA